MAGRVDLLLRAQLWACGVAGTPPKASNSSAEPAAEVYSRWMAKPEEVLARLAAGFLELQRRRHQVPERPDRKYAAVAAHAS